MTDVAGVRVGHAHRVGEGWLTGVTVLLPPPGTVAGVDVRGGGPGTAETDALAPDTLVPTVDAVVLAGGSAFGLAAADGVRHWCAEKGLGYPVGDGVVVPIVPAAVVFDLARGGDAGKWPGPGLGRQAAAAAVASTPARGCVGAGTGAVLDRGWLKGGVGTASVDVGGGLVVGALVVANAAGSPVDPTTGALLGAWLAPRPVRPAAPTPAEHAAVSGARAGFLTAGGPAASRTTLLPGRTTAPNTTLAIVVTTADLDPARCRRTATAAHDGLARAMRPAHTLVDGDTVFALATGQQPVAGLEELVALQAAAADAVTLAVLDAVLSSTRTSTATGDVPAYLDRYPSARG